MTKFDRERSGGLTLPDLFNLLVVLHLGKSLGQVNGSKLPYWTGGVGKHDCVGRAVAKLRSRRL